MRLPSQRMSTLEYGARSTVSKSLTSCQHTSMSPLPLGVDRQIEQEDPGLILEAHARGVSVSGWSWMSAPARPAEISASADILCCGAGPAIYTPWYIRLPAIPA